ncbi:MAG: type 4a pilus biogenesis protein PilO [Deltaproteobacteria bacterium]|nr:type 4a pilus biogenesis protein PilO [Deltaproteobacteria bacterium]
MAASGAMADFAALPTQRKVLIFVVIAMLLGALYYQFMFKSLNADVEAVEQEKTTKLQQDSKLARDLPEYEKLKKKFGELQKIVTENQKALPTESELPAFFENLNRKVKDSGVEIANWKQEAEEPVETFVKVPVRLELNGTFLQLKRFFASLVQKREDVQPNPDQPEVTERERIVSIEGLSLGDPKIRNREIILTARFIAATYRQDEAKAPAKAPGAPAAPGPAKPANTAPPMPSAATPAGAKVRTEDALKKGEAIIREGGGVEEAKMPAAGSARLKGGL